MSSILAIRHISVELRMERPDIPDIRSFHSEFHRDVS